MTLSLLDAFDTVSHSEALLTRLEAAAAELSRKQGLRDEKAWLDAAVTRVRNAREGVGDLLTRVLRLPELESMREDHARSLQGAVVDAVERLHAGITFAAGSRAPLLEALYGRLKLPVLRRCDREDFEKFCTDFDKRLNSTYAKRMFADASFALVQPALAQLAQTVAVWRGVFIAEPPSPADAQALRDELDAVARRLELPVRQARALAEAALAPLRELLEAAQVTQKPKRRAGPKAAVELEDERSLLDEEPVDPAQPSADELAELQAAEPAPTPPAVEEPPAPTVEAASAVAAEPKRARKSRQAEA